jgi:hypothetical protein
MFIFSLFAIVAGLSQYCPDGTEQCIDDTQLCIDNKFCVSSDVENYPSAMFAAGFGSFFVPQNGLQQAACIENVENELQDLFTAMQQFENGDISDAAGNVFSGFQAAYGIVQNCNGNGPSFWDDVLTVFEYVADYFCPECGAIFDGVEFVVNGVDIMSDWVSMVKQCGAKASPSDDDWVSCGQMFADSIQRIYDVSNQGANSEARKISYGEPLAVGETSLVVGDGSNCAENDDACGCSWSEEGQCATEIGGCATACAATFGAACLTCLKAIDDCQECICYYVCKYNGPGKAAYQVCPDQYENCADSGSLSLLASK